MELKDLLYETRNQAAWITLNRPRLLNALSAEMLTSIRRSYEAAGDDRDVRAVVITGAGRGFCAGADIHVMDNASPMSREARPRQTRLPVKFVEQRLRVFPDRGCLTDQKPKS